jgi:DNA recombination protein RmuC
MSRTSEQLRTETTQLVSALRAPQVRGRWGELQLRRVVESAGMLEHVDFSEQESATTPDGRLRPDLVVKLAGGKNVVIDSKVAFNGYLEAMEARDEATHRTRLQAHARHFRTHIESLGAKKYWDQFTPAPEFVVMFVPADAFLNAALEHDPTLLEHAFERNVVIATPATLVAMLRTIAYTWRQEALARNAQDVLVTARKMADLKVVSDDLETPAQVERVTRNVQAPELVASASDALVAIDDITADARYGVTGTRQPADPQRRDSTG